MSPLELSEAANRIFRRHAVLIVALVLLGLGAAFLLHVDDKTQYVATARFVLDTADPQSSSESQAIADTARAIATGPDQVATALRRVGAHRDALDVAQHDIGVEALGTSGVLELTVTDESAKVAASLANALANRIIEARVAISTGRVDRIIGDLNAQIDDVTKQIVDADTKLDDLNSKILRTTDPATLLGLRNERDNVAQTRDYLAQRRVVLESERATIATSDALRPQATLLDPAQPPTAPAPNRAVPDMALGALLGFLLAVGGAAGIEALRPSVVGADAIARETSAPVLGELPAPPDEVLPEEVVEVASHLGLAAGTARLDRVELFGTDPTTDLFLLSMQLREYRHWRQGPARPGKMVTHVRARNGRSRRPTATAVADRRDTHMPLVGVALADTGTTNGSTRAGLVLVTPDAVRRSDLATAVNFHLLSGWPLLGVVTYRRRRRLWSAGLSSARSHDEEEASRAGGELQEGLS